jgi:hypothetical protein
LSAGKILTAELPCVNVSPDKNEKGCDSMKLLDRLLADKPALKLWLRYFILFLMLFISIALAALRHVISVESNPFFYANF